MHSAHDSALSAPPTARRHACGEGGRYRIDKAAHESNLAKARRRRAPRAHGGGGGGGGAAELLGSAEGDGGGGMHEPGLAGAPEGSEASSPDENGDETCSDEGLLRAATAKEGAAAAGGARRSHGRSAHQQPDAEWF